MITKDVLLINPPDLFSELFPSGLAYIARPLVDEGVEVEVLDFVGQRSSDKTLIPRALDRIHRGKSKIVGLTGLAHNYPWLKDFSFEIKSRFRDVHIIAGGHWSYHEPEFILQNTAVDIVVNGEGDRVIFPLCRAVLEKTGFSKIAGITFKDDGQIISTGFPELVKDLDELPLPPYDLFDMKKYVPRIDPKKLIIPQGSSVPFTDIEKRFLSKKTILEMSMLTGRGCIGKCMFCTGEKQPYRKFTPQYVIRHIKFLQDTLGVETIRFKEALTLGNRKWVVDFCNLLIKEKIAILYECISRVDTIDEDVVKLLKETGCYQIQFGIESGDDTILSEIAQKNITAETAKRAIALCIRNNIVPRGGFIIGLPGETIATLNKTLGFIWETKTEATGVTFPTPFPGTRLFAFTLEKCGITKNVLFLDSTAMRYDEKSQDRIIHRYNLTELKPFILKFYRFLFNEVCILNRLRKNRRFFRFMFEVLIIAELKIFKQMVLNR